MLTLKAWRQYRHLLEAIPRYTPMLDLDRLASDLAKDIILVTKTEDPLYALTYAEAKIHAAFLRILADERRVTAEALGEDQTS